MDETTEDRRSKGLARYRAVYGPDAQVFAEGSAPFFDLMLEQLFAEVWTRPGLAIEQRRLLTLGVLAGQGQFEVVGRQFRRVLETGELTTDQIREVVIHLVAYTGYGASGELHRVGEEAIAAYLDAANHEA